MATINSSEVREVSYYTAFDNIRFRTSYGLINDLKPSLSEEEVQKVRAEIDVIMNTDQDTQISEIQSMINSRNVFNADVGRAEVHYSEKEIEEIVESTRNQACSLLAQLEGIEGIQVGKYIKQTVSNLLEKFPGFSEISSEEKIDFINSVLQHIEVCGMNFVVLTYRKHKSGNQVGIESESRKSPSFFYYGTNIK